MGIDGFSECRDGEDELTIIHAEAVKRLRNALGECEAVSILIPSGLRRDTASLMCSLIQKYMHFVSDYKISKAFSPMCLARRLPFERSLGFCLPTCSTSKPRGRKLTTFNLLIPIFRRSQEGYYALLAAP